MIYRIVEFMDGIRTAEYNYNTSHEMLTDLNTIRLCNKDKNVIYDSELIPESFDHDGFEPQGA